MSDSLSEFDVIILGSGPAGLQAAIHAARAKAEGRGVGTGPQELPVQGSYRKLLLHGGHAFRRRKYWKQGKHQAEKFGARFFEYDVLGAGPRRRRAFCDPSGERRKACCLVVDPGDGDLPQSSQRPGEKELLGKGVSYCVDCDANFFRDEVVVVVGNESAACSGALNLAADCSRGSPRLRRHLDVSEHLHYQIERSSIHEHAGAQGESDFGEQ